MTLTGKYIDDEHDDDIDTPRFEMQNKYLLLAVWVGNIQTKSFLKYFLFNWQVNLFI